MPGPELDAEPSASVVSLDVEASVQDLRAEEGAANELIPLWAVFAVGDPDALVYIRRITSCKLRRRADEGGTRLECGKFCPGSLESSAVGPGSRLICARTVLIEVCT